MYKTYNHLLYILFIGFIAQTSASTISDTLKLDRNTYERLFLEKNLSLLAQRMSITQEEALLVQEKTWNNPSLSLSNINLWSPDNETSSQQFEIALEILIQTAGKRNHRIELQKISGRLAVKEYEDLLRQLRKEVRSKLATLVYYQEILPVYARINQSVAQILEVDKEQSLQRNHPREELLRLQTMSLGLAKEIFEIQQEKEDLAGELKQFIQLTPSTNLILIGEANYRILENFYEINLS